jgi:hypothetical protein
MYNKAVSLLSDSSAELLLKAATGINRLVVLVAALFARFRSSQSQRK